MIKETLIPKKSLEQLKKAQGILKISDSDNILDRYIITYEDFMEKEKEKGKKKVDTKK